MYICRYYLRTHATEHNQSIYTAVIMGLLVWGKDVDPTDHTRLKSQVMLGVVSSWYSQYLLCPCVYRHLGCTICISMEI